MKEVFTISEYDRQGNLRLYKYNFSSYEEALSVIEKRLPPGTYQVQKVFVKK